MTIDEFVAFTNARKIGKGKWVARCVAHPDRHPSMHIWQGRKGVMVSCMSQHCSVEAICAALGIPVESLFYDSGRRLSRREVEEMRQKEALCAQEARQRARIRRVALRKAGMWEEAANRLGGLLMRYPNNRLDRLFRAALANSRRCEAVANAFDEKKRGVSPGWSEAQAQHYLQMACAAATLLMIPLSERGGIPYTIWNKETQSDETGFIGAKDETLEGVVRIGLEMYWIRKPFPLTRAGVGNKIAWSLGIKA